MRHFILGITAAAAVGFASVASAAPTQDEIAYRVADQLRESGELSDYCVSVKYEKGVAWLLGSVQTKQQAKAAIRLAKQVDGVKRVVNKLDIVQAEQDDLVLAMLHQQQLEAMQEQTEATQDLGETQGYEEYEQAPSMPLGNMPRGNAPRPIRQASMNQPRPVRPASYGGMAPTPQGYTTGGAAGVSYDSANMPGYAWPSYAAYPNYSALTYPQQYSPSAWPYIGPFYPYPQVPLGWRKVTLEWDDGWWFLDFSHHKGH